MAIPLFASVPLYPLGTLAVLVANVAVYGRCSMVEAELAFRAATVSWRKNRTFLRVNQSCPIGAMGTMKLDRLAKNASPTASLGWLYRMSSRQELTAAFSCQHWDSWT